MANSSVWWEPLGQRYFCCRFYLPVTFATPWIGPLSISDYGIRLSCPMSLESPWLQFLVIYLPFVRTCALNRRQKEQKILLGNTMLSSYYRRSTASRLQQLPFLFPKPWAGGSQVNRMACHVCFYSTSNQRCTIDLFLLYIYIYFFFFIPHRPSLDPAGLAICYILPLIL